jgi:hypothetical protein
MASAPRGTGPPVAIGVAVPDTTGALRCGTASDDFFVQQQAHRRSFRRRREISRANRKTVDIEAIERRHVDRCDDVVGKRATERVREAAFALCITAKKPRRMSSDSEPLVVRVAEFELWQRRHRAWPVSCSDRQKAKVPGIFMVI